MQECERKTQWQRDWEETDRNRKQGSHFKTAKAKCYFVQSTHVEYPKLNTGILQVSKILLCFTATAKYEHGTYLCKLLRIRYC